MSSNNNNNTNRPRTRAIPDKIEDLRITYSAPDKDGNVRILSDRRPQHEKERE